MDWINEKAKTLRQGAIRAMFDKASTMDNVISMGIGEPDMATPELVCRAGNEALEKGITHYTPNAGTPALRRAIAEKSNLKGVGYDPTTEIIITNGGMGALSLLFLVLLNPGDEALIPAPAFLSYGSCVHMASGVPVFVPTEQAKGFQPEPDVLERHITPKTKLILINSPQNPTGTVYPRETLQGIADLAIRHDLIVVSDEINEKIIFDGEEHISIASLPGMRERTVVLNGFSKAYAMTGSRIGYAAGPERLIAPIYCAHQYSAMCPCTYAQWGAVAALRGPQGHIADMVKELDRRRLMLLDRLAAMPGVSFVRPKGAFYIMVSIPGLGTPMQAAEFLLDAGLAIVPWDEEHLRISYANSYENLSIAMDRMEKALRGRF